jgi:protein-tyrosine phosphatase
MKVSSPQRVLECYWVLPGRFLAGEYPAHDTIPGATQRLEALLEAGIDSFIDLTKAGELDPYLPLLERIAIRRAVHIDYTRFPIADLGLPERFQMLATLDYLDTALAAGRRIYLHCWGGIGRTGLTVGCFLIRHGMTGQQALDQIADWWQGTTGRRSIPRSPETPQQVQFVLDWRKPNSGDVQ